MFKKILAACAGVLVSGGIVFAGQLNGTYAGQSNGQNVSVTLQSDGDVIRGSVECGGATLPLVGRENNGVVQGIWRAPDGQNMPFVAATNGDNLELKTNGITYALSKEGGNAAAPVRGFNQQDPQAFDRQQFVPQARPASFNARMEQGQFFQAPVPEGWTRTEGTNETWVAAPDQSMAIGFTGLEAINTGTPIQFLTYMATKVYKLQNFRVLEAHRIEAQGADAIEAIYTVTASNGRPVKSWARVAIVQGYGSNGYCLLASAYAENFDQVIGGLKALAEKIQITNFNQVFQRDIRLGVQQNTNLNHPMDHSFADGYWKNQKTMDGISARRSDVMRDSYTSTDPHTGTQYNHTGAAFDYSGRVVNPVRPNEYLEQAEHWKGH